MSTEEVTPGCVVIPAQPQITGGPPATWNHRALYDRVIAAIYAIEDKFETALNISGVPVSDLFTMNSALGAAIEKSVVESLNDLKGFWDPDSNYSDYRFIRQAQCFPDVLLKSTNPNSDPEIIMGIELKGWFVLSKEGEPSFRYKIAPQCCAEADLLVVMPWIFDSVVSGKPKLMTPIISEARYAAEMRNFHWTWLRANRTSESQNSRAVVSATHDGYYPEKSDQISDRPVRDSGNNFGRIARCGVFDADVEERLKEDALGISVDAWRRFLKIFSDTASPEAALNGLDQLANLFLGSGTEVEDRREAARLLRQLSELIDLTD